MAPRRLIIVMVALLALSTALAILIPESPPDAPDRQEAPVDGSRQGDETPATGTDEAADRRSQDRAGEEVEAPAGSGRRQTLGRTILTTRPTERIPVRPGDRLVLEVRSSEPLLIEIGGAGLTDLADPYDPARFDLLIREKPSRLVVREVGGADRKIAVIEVR